jgi:hypothetical protein
MVEIVGSINVIKIPVFKRNDTNKLPPKKNYGSIGKV